MISIKAALEKLKTETDQRRQKEVFSALVDATKIISNYESLAGQQTEQTFSSAPSSPQPATASDQKQSPASPTISINPTVWFRGQENISIWMPFKLACQPSMPPKLRETALDLIQKILSSSHQGSAKDSNNLKLKTLHPINYPVGEVPSPSAGPARDSSTASSPTTAQQQQSQQSFQPTLMDDIVHTISMASPLSSFSESSSTAAEQNVHLQIIKALLTVITSPECEVHEQSLLKTFQVCFNIYLFSKPNSTNQLTAKASLTQMCHFVFSRMETFIQSLGTGNNSANQSSSELSTSGSTTNRSSSEHSTDPEVLLKDSTFYAELLKRDALYTLRFLCKLAMKVEKTASTNTTNNTPAVEDDLSPILIRTRALALELILLILNNSGPTLQYQDSFVTFVKQNVTLTISKNGLATQPILFELSLSVFLLLLKFFKSQLKAEIEVIFGEIYLFILDNPLSTLKQKLMVLQGLFKIVNSPQILVDLYVNYDCDLNMNSIYEGIVNSVSSICGGAGSQNPNSKQPQKNSLKAFGANPDANALQERRIRSKSLRCLLAIIASLSEWMKESSNSEGTGLSAQAVDFKPISRETSTDENEQDRKLTSPDSGISTNGPTPVMIYKNPLKSVSMTEAPSIAPSRNSRSPGTADEIEGTQTPAKLSDPEEYERIKALKYFMKQGVAKFNENPSKGITLLQDQKLLTDIPSIVHFLKNTPDLHKSAIGDYLGDGKEFNIRVMHSFVDSFEFTRMGFVSALRRFLQSFRLPGEAQKIDRIMEKFAARYCDNNPGVFAKADVAYTLAFSIMMLNTDQHSTRIKSRMTKSDFIRNNRGINDNGDLPDELLSNIFDDINKNEIILEEEQTVKELEKMTSVGFSVAGDRQKREIFKRETKHIEKKSQNLMKKGKERVFAPFKSATHVDHARPMFEILWGPLMASISTIFEECSADDYPSSQSIEEFLTDSSNLPSGESNSEVIHLCLIGFVLAIRISCNLHLDVERNAFVSSLGKLTCLNDLSDLKAKNVAAAKTLISTCLQHSNMLEESWQFFLSCISDMDKWHLIGDGSKITNIITEKKPETRGFLGGSSATDSSLSDSSSELRAIYHRRPSLSGLTQEFSSQQMLITVDKVFSNSVNLDGNSIVHFFRSLCQVAEMELESSRLYMLQKVVEIAYYNMNRIRLEWTQIWKILTAFFNSVGCHPNVNVATYAVDSLRQLGMKFLDRDELAHFTSHNEFFKPFEHIMKNSSFSSIKDLVLQSIHQMISSRSQNIKSGWRTVFAVLSRATYESQDPTLIWHAFEIVKEVPVTYWEKMNEFFVEYTVCLVEFTLIEEELARAPGQSTDEDIINGSLRLISESTSRLAKEYTEIPLTDDQFYLKWFPILSGLSRIQRDGKFLMVRSKALGTFFEILSNHGKMFSFEGKQWKTIIKTVVLPVFEDLKMHDSEEFDPDEDRGRRREIVTEATQSSLWIQSLRHLIDVYSQFFISNDSSRSNECFLANLDLLKELLDLIVLLCGRNSQNLAQTGIIYLNEFVKRNSQHFNQDVWNLVIHTIESITSVTIPVELFRLPTGKKSANKPLTDVAVEEEARIIASIDLQHAILKCAIHLFLLDFIRDLCFDANDYSLAILRNTHKQTSNFSASISLLPSKTYSSLSFSHQSRILSCLHASYIFASSFNSNYELRQALYNLKVVEKMPSLIRQEVQSVSIYLSLCCHLYRCYGDEEGSSDEETKVDLLAPSNLLYKKTHNLFECFHIESFFILEKYAKHLGDTHRYNNDLHTWAPVIYLIFKEVLSLPWANQSSGNPIGSKFNLMKRSLPAFFRAGIKLIATDQPDVRAVLQEFMMRIAAVIDKDVILDSL